MSNQQIAGPNGINEYQPPVDTSRVLLSIDIKELVATRDKLMRRLRFLQALSETGRGEQPSPGADSISVNDDITALLGQLNAINKSLAALNDNGSIVPGDTDRAVGVIWKKDGSLTDEAREVLNSIGDERKRDVFNRALYQVGQYAATNTAFLRASGASKMGMLSAPIEDRSFLRLVGILQKSLAASLSEDESDRAKIYQISQEDLALAKKSKQWTNDNDETLQYVLSQGKLRIEAGKRAAAEPSARLAEVDKVLATLRSKPSRTPEDLRRIMELQKQRMEITRSIK